MDGPATGTVEGHDALGRFTKRHGEYAAKKRRLAALGDRESTPRSSRDDTLQQPLSGGLIVVLTHFAASCSRHLGDVLVEGR
jgi:hypothetical protein